MSCAKIYNIGCFLACGEITIPVQLAPGEYTARFIVGLSAIQEDIDVVDGKFATDASVLPIGREILVQFLQDDEIVCATIEGVEYCQFKLKIMVPAATSTGSGSTGVTVKTVTVNFDPIDNGQVSYVDVSVPGMILGNNFTISRVTDLSSLEDDFVMITEKVISNETLRVYVENQSGEDGVVIPAITYKIYL